MRSNLVEPGSQLITTALCIALMRRARIQRATTNPLTRFLADETPPSPHYRGR